MSIFDDGMNHGYLPWPIYVKQLSHYSSHKENIRYMRAFESDLDRAIDIKNEELKRLGNLN